MSRDSFLGYHLERGCTVSVGIKNSILGPTLPLIQEKYTMKVVPFSLGFLCIIWVAVPVFSDSSAYQYYQYDYNQVDENQVGYWNAHDRYDNYPSYNYQYPVSHP